MKTYSIAYAAALMKKGYSAAFRQLSIAGKLVTNPENGRVAVSAEFIEELGGKQRGVNKALLEPLKHDNYAVPPLDPGAMMITMTTLKSHLPFLQGMCEDVNTLRRLTSFGKWRVKVSNGVNRFHLPDFFEPKSWASPAEASFRALADYLAPVVAEQPGNEMAKAGLTLADLWVNQLYEDRVGLRRALGQLTESAHRAALESARKSVYANKDAWESPDFRALLPADMEILL